METVRVFPVCFLCACFSVCAFVIAFGLCPREWDDNDKLANPFSTFFILFQLVR